MQAEDNVTDALRARGLEKTVKLIRAYDVNFALGGPIKQDRIWFFTAVRNMSTKNESIGVFFNTTQGTPFYTPDLDRPAFSKDWLKSVASRVTWQMSDNNKLNVFSDPRVIRRGGRDDFGHRRRIPVGGCGRQGSIRPHGPRRCRAGC